MVITRKEAMKRRGWSGLAEKGLDKFSSLKSSKSITAYRNKFKAKGGKPGNSEKFYEFVARSRLRKK